MAELADDPWAEKFPFVATSVARTLASMLQETHEDRAMSVITGPWGIGKTTIVNKFQRDNPLCFLVVKVAPGARHPTASAVAIMQSVVEAAQTMIFGERRAVHLGSSLNPLRVLFSQVMARHPYWLDYADDPAGMPPFTIIFDEAQFISRQAMEVIRYMNDPDRGMAPFPIGLFFVGNPELSLSDAGGGQSVISGAVRSRSAYIESLKYSDLSDADLAQFLQSRGISDPAALNELVRYFGQPRVPTDLRAVQRLAIRCSRRAGDQPVTAAIVRSILNP